MECQAAPSEREAYRAALNDLGPAIRAKVRAYQVDYVGSIADI
jgi:hypothetical protein